MLGALRQQGAEGELQLEQNDGTRRLFFANGNLRYLRSDASGEQFGNYLLRLGVLNFQALQEALADKDAKVGDQVVQRGLMTEQERDGRLHELFAAIMLHALEHPVHKTSWIPQSLDRSLGQDLQFPLDHRFLIWKVFDEISCLPEMAELLEEETQWKWRASGNLLDSLSDLPLTPKLAYALTELGSEPMGYETILAVTRLDEAECARLVLVCWALGGLELVDGPSPLQSEPPPAPPEPEKLSTPPTIDLDFGSDAGEPELEIQPQAKLEAEAAAAAADSAAPPPGIAPPIAPDIAPEIATVTPQQKARLLYRQAESLELQGRPGEAIRSLEQSIKLDADSPRAYEAWMLLGRLRLANPAWSTRAVEALQVAARIRPSSAEPWVLMGELYFRKDFLVNARNCYRKAIELDPSVLVPMDLTMPEEAVDPKEDHPGFFGLIRGLIKGDKK